jgi:predicted transcriptional regulator
VDCPHDIGKGRKIFRFVFENSSGFAMFEGIIKSNSYDRKNMHDKNDTLQIAPDLMVRLEALATKNGRSLADFAAGILQSHAENEECKQIERAEDEQRWQRYLAEGRTVSFETVRNKLRDLTAEAARKANPQ